MPPPAKPPLRPGQKASPEKPPPEPTPQQKLEKLAASGYVDVNDASRFIGDIKGKKPDRALLRELKLTLIRHQGVFDRAAAQKLKTFFDTYKAEDDVD